MTDLNRWPYRIGDELGVAHLGTGRWVWGKVIKMVSGPSKGTQLTIQPHDLDLARCATYAFYLRGTLVWRPGDKEPKIIEEKMLAPIEHTGYSVPDGVLMRLEGTSADGLFRKAGMDPDTGAMILRRVPDDQVVE